MSLVYLYGFVPRDAGLPERGLLGVAGEEVERVDMGEIVGVVSRVDEAVFGADALEPRTSDVEWMAELGLRHEQVVAWFVDTASILPSRLLTLFSGDDALRSAARRDSHRIRAALDRFADAREWDLKVAYEADRLVEHLAEVSDAVRDLDAQIRSATPGKRFLLEKKRKELARTEARDGARRLAAELLDRLRPDADDVAVLKPPADAAPVVLNAALLVPRDREAGMLERAESEAERLERLGLVVAFTGPWAPYRFLDDHG